MFQTGKIKHDSFRVYPHVNHLYLMASSIANSCLLPLKTVIEEPSRMELELDSSSVESEDFSFGQKDIRLDVKLAFARVCNLIDALPDNKESMYLLKKIHNEAKSVMRKKRSGARPNETHSSNITTQLPGEETFLSSQASRRNQHDSFREPLTSSFNGQRRKTQLNHSSLLSKGEFESNCLRTIKNGNTCDTGNISLAPISEVGESASFVEDHSSLDSESIQETLGDSETFTLKKWSVKKVDNDLYLTGVKLDRKGNIIEREFISDKILARPESEVIRTADGDFLLQETLIDPKKIIPEEVRNIFLKEKYFPKNWRKALSLWNEIEKKSQNESKKAEIKPKESERAENDKNTSNKGNKKGTPADNKKKTPNQKKTPSEKLKSSGKKTPGEKKVMSDKKTPTGRKPPNDKKNSSIGEPKTNKENKKNVLNQSKKNTPVEVQKAGKKKLNSVEKNNKDSTDKPQAKKKPRVNKKKEINDKGSAPKKRKSVEEKMQKPKEDVEELALSDCELGFVESDGESMFNLPQTSMTPTGLLASIKKQQIKGRYTPPTDIFDNVYGPSSTTNTSINNTSFANPSHKNNNVVKRLEKAKNTIKTQKKKEAGFVEKVVEDEENALIADVIRAAQLKTTTTPTLLKEVFRKQDMSCDESDFDSESSFH